MAYLEGFDASKVDPNEPLQPIPAGTYLVKIKNTERKATKSGNGDLLELSFEVQDGPYRGRTVKTRLNMWNSNPTAKKIAWGDMSAICRAVGIMQPNDSTDLHDLPLEILVGLTNPNADGKMYNEINGYQKRGTSSGGGQTPPAPTTTPQSPATPATKPAWM